MDKEKIIKLMSLLENIDTPTVCNALELIEPNRRNFGYTDLPMNCLYPSMKPIIGVAKTATCRSLRPSLLSSEMLKSERVKYYTYIDAGDLPKIVVMQDLDGDRKGHGPFWGEFNTRIHKALGCRGIVTDNTIRDVPSLPDDIQILSMGLKPSHGNIHIVDYDIQVNVASMVVNPGDLVHLDLHGAVTFPISMAEEVIEKANEFMKSEEAVLEACRKTPNLELDQIIKLYMLR